MSQPDQQHTLNTWEVPFDQHGRYADLRDLYHRLFPEHTDNTRISILDVGGYFLPLEGDPYLPCKLFFPQHTVVGLDRASPSQHLADYIRGDALHLPFASASFDWVNASDVIEHIPTQHREAFIGELVRCSKDLISLSTPIDSDLVNLAEELVFKSIERLMHIRHEALEEHRTYGLMSSDHIMDILKHLVPHCEVHVIPSGNLFRWLFMMISLHQFLALAPEQGLNREIDSLYNRFCYESDNQPPTYRNIYWVSRKGRKPKPPYPSPEDRLNRQPNQTNDLILLDLLARVEAHQQWHQTREIAQQKEHLVEALNAMREENAFLKGELEVLRQSIIGKLRRKLFDLVYWWKNHR